jgi:hypothetical protein
MRFGRHRRAVAIKLNRRKPEDVIAGAREKRGILLREEGLVSFVSPKGRVRARVTPLRFRVPARLVVQVAPAERGTEVTGEMRESYLEVFFPRFYAFLGGLLLLAALGLLFEGRSSVVSVMCTAPFGAIFVWLGIRLERKRPIAFEDDTDTLDRIADRMFPPTGRR